jgi:hypothetical protein
MQRLLTRGRPLKVCTNKGCFVSRGFFESWWPKAYSRSFSRLLLAQTLHTLEEAKLEIGGKVTCCTW